MMSQPTASDYRTAARACREAAISIHHDRAKEAYFLLNDLGLGDMPGSWSELAVWLGIQADKLDPPKPGVILYTSAPAAFDGFSVRELDAHAGTDDWNKTIRKVSVENRDILWFIQRCHSGNHACVTEDELPKFKAFWTMNEGG